jgi:hypothetical protein
MVLWTVLVWNAALFLRDLEGPPLPALVAGLSGNIQAADLEFRKRIRERFPVGSSEIELFQALEQAGFRPGWEIGAQRAAYFTQPGFPCARDRWIRWRADDDRIITEIDSGYGTSCL